MKKFIFIFSLLFISLLLISCDNDEKEEPIVPVDLSISVVHEEVINNQIHLSVTLLNVVELDDMAIIMNEIANEVYLDYFDEIDGRLFYLNISGYSTLVEFEDDEEPLYGTYVYGINLGLDRPGLSFVRID
jgi:hypothetical protein